MPDPFAWFAAIVTTVIVIVVGRRWQQAEEDAPRMLEPEPKPDPQRASVADGVEGVVRVEGVVVAPPPPAVTARGREEPLIAPMSWRRCLFFEVVVFDLSGASRQLLRRARGRWFQVNDGTGNVWVTFSHPGPAPRAVEGPPGVWCSSPPNQPPPSESRLEALFREAGIDPSELPGLHLLSVSETAIGVGDRIAVVGSAHTEADPTGESQGYRVPALRYVLEPTPERPLELIKLDP